ncbi:hypothetical protein L9Z73_03350 [Pseudomonas sp. TNT11]|uniref:Uncharacterized protein n=1 Tax=Pseudomonas emilianonis TaxID=2915812 RepID=A0ABT0ED55_9PSED|nr:hypothetical protein [Pseudomonas emilianonis]MCK1783429.1 hypothetical protein [Pseudomonas emilianonis]
MLWYCVIDSAERMAMPEDQPWTVAPGWVEMLYPPPDTRPDRFGDWLGRSTGEWEWVKYPDPPFNVVFHDGKLKNADTMLEISIETLPGNLAARLEALEAAALPPPQ